MVSGLILLVCRWYILERSEMWKRSKENYSSDATSVYVCESNKELSENTTSGEFIIEWNIHWATASLSLLYRSGSVGMHRYQGLSNTYAWHTCLYSLLLTHQRCKSTETTRMTRLLTQQPKILAESTCKSMVLVKNEWQYAS